MSEILLVEKKLVIIEDGYFKNGEPFLNFQNTRKGNLYLFQDGDSYWLELRTMLDMVGRYGNMAKGIAGVAVDNIDELAEKALFGIGKSVLAGLMNVSRQVAAHTENPISTPNFDAGMEKLKESHYNLDDITDKIWSRKLDTYSGVRLKNNCLYMLHNSGNYTSCNCVRFESAGRADKWLRYFCDTPVFERISNQ